MWIETIILNNEPKDVYPSVQVLKDNGFEDIIKLFFKKYNFVKNEYNWDKNKQLCLDMKNIVNLNEYLFNSDNKLSPFALSFSVSKETINNLNVLTDLFDSIDSTYKKDLLVISLASGNINKETLLYLSENISNKERLQFIKKIALNKSLPMEVFEDIFKEDFRNENNHFKLDVMSKLLRSNNFLSFRKFIEKEPELLHEADFCEVKLYESFFEITVLPDADKEVKDEIVNIFNIISDNVPFIEDNMIINDEKTFSDINLFNAVLNKIEFEKEADNITLSNTYFYNKLFKKVSDKFILEKIISDNHNYGANFIYLRNNNNKDMIEHFFKQEKSQEKVSIFFGYYFSTLKNQRLDSKDINLFCSFIDKKVDLINHKTLGVPNIDIAYQIIQKLKKQNNEEGDNQKIILSEQVLGNMAKEFFQASQSMDNTITNIFIKNVEPNVILELIEFDIITNDMKDSIKNRIDSDFLLSAIEKKELYLTLNIDSIKTLPKKRL